MLFIGGLAAYQFVWDLGDVGVGLMTVFNMIALIPLAPKALAALRDYEQNVMEKSTEMGADRIRGRGKERTVDSYGIARSAENAFAGSGADRRDRLWGSLLANRRESVLPVACGFLCLLAGSGQSRVLPDLVDTEEKLNAILEPCGNIIPKV